MIKSGVEREAVDLEFLPVMAEKGALFKSYVPRGKSTWQSNWTSKFNLTGVSWNDPRCATLIDPQFVVMAAHFQRPSNVPLFFHDRSGKSYERYAVAYRTLTVGDIAVAKLNLPLPPSVKPFRLVNANDVKPGAPVIVSDQTGTLSIHQIASVNGSSIAFQFQPDLNPVYQRNLIVGDSGHPSFVIKRGELFLVGTHTTGGPGAGPFYGDPVVQGAIRKSMAEMNQ